MTRRKGDLGLDKKDIRWSWTDFQTPKRWLNNNFSEDTIVEYDETIMQYHLFQYEVCPETNKIHIQGYTVFKEPFSRRQLSERFPTVHLERCKGNHSHNQIYCTKPESRFAPGAEYGSYTQPIPGKHTSLQLYEDDVKNNELSYGELRIKYATIFSRTPNAFFAMYHLHRPIGDDRKVESLRVYSLEEMDHEKDVFHVENFLHPGIGYNGQSAIFFPMVRHADFTPSFNRMLMYLVSGKLSVLSGMYGIRVPCNVTRVFLHCDDAIPVSLTEYFPWSVKG